MVVHVFIIGSKGIPARYGGFETFVDKLTAGKRDDRIQYHVSCLSDQSGEFQYNGARCFKIKTPGIGGATALWYDILSLRNCFDYIRENNLQDCIIYILACRIGPYLAIFEQKLKDYGVRIYLNPDGQEWSRSKWNSLIQTYWKFSERLMVKHSDLIICDSRAIENYIKHKYRKYQKETAFIAYGADIGSQAMDDIEPYDQWIDQYKIRTGYYLIVGRFVPENNYSTIIKEFIVANLEKDLVIITNFWDNRFYRDLQNMTSFSSHSNIKFVGTVYDQNLLLNIRQNAFAYLHGHEVGGTNPSLLEAMGNTKLNIVLDVVFNREVAGDSALYFTKQEGALATLLKEIEGLDLAEIDELGVKAKKRILECYSWDDIIKNYEVKFMSKNKVGTRLSEVQEEPTCI